MFKKKTIFLPTTSDEFEILIDRLVKDYKLPDRNHAAAVVSNRIMHLPPEQATATLEYFGHCVIKNIAFQLAQSKGQMVQHKNQINTLFATLTSTPGDTQARDTLEAAAKDGSEYAKEKLAELDGARLRVVPEPSEQEAPATNESTA